MEGAHPPLPHPPLPHPPLPHPIIVGNVRVTETFPPEIWTVGDVPALAKMSSADHARRAWGQETWSVKFSTTLPALHVKQTGGTAAELRRLLAAHGAVAERCALRFFVWWSNS